jgi:hypothetical protein
MPRSLSIRIVLGLSLFALCGCARKVPMGQVEGTVRVKELVFF